MTYQECVARALQQSSLSPREKSARLRRWEQAHDLGRIGRNGFSNVQAR